LASSDYLFSLIFRILNSKRWSKFLKDFTPIYDFIFDKWYYIDAQTLLTLFGEYQKPRERILYMVNNKELIRLKNGFYLITDKVREGSHLTIP